VSSPVASYRSQREKKGALEKKKSPYLQVFCTEKRKPRSAKRLQPLKGSGFTPYRGKRFEPTPKKGQEAELIYAVEADKRGDHSIENYANWIESRRFFLKTKGGSGAPTTVTGGKDSRRKDRDRDFCPPQSEGTPILTKEKGEEPVSSSRRGNTVHMSRGREGKSLFFITSSSATRKDSFLPRVRKGDVVARRGKKGKKTRLYASVAKKTAYHPFPGEKGKRESPYHWLVGETKKGGKESPSCAGSRAKSYLFVHVRRGKNPLPRW